MLHWGLGVAAVLIPVQLFFGHLTGKYVYEHQPTKFAAIEARWQPQQPGSEVWLAWPDEARKKNLFAIETPGVGSFIATGSWTAAVPGLSDFPEDDWPPVIPFFGFRIMVGMGLICVAVSWAGNVLRWRGRLETPRWFPWPTFLAFPSVAIIAGWYTAEVGRQPWVVYGLLRTADAHTPTLTTSDVLTSLIGYVVVYAVIYSFGLYYIYHLLRDGPTDQAHEITRATAMRPMAAAGSAETATGATWTGREVISMDASWLAVFWAALIAFAILVYVLLDGFDLGIGVLFGTTRSELSRPDVDRHRAVLGWQRDLAGDHRASLFGAFPMVYAIFLPAFTFPLRCCCSRLIRGLRSSSAIAPNACAGCGTGDSSSVP